MSQPSRRTRSGDQPHLTDAELDLLLESTGTALLGYVQTVTDPMAGLITLMEQTTRPADHDPDEFHRQPGAAALATRVWASEAARAVIQSNGSAQALDIALAQALDAARANAFTRSLFRDLDLAVTRTRDLASLLDNVLAEDVDRMLSLEITLIRSIARDLDLGLTIVRDRTSTLDRDLELWGLAPGFARAFARALQITRDLARVEGQARELAALANRVTIDVTAADLSKLDVDLADVGVLAGMLWSTRTKWPPGIVERMLACSECIRDGVFRVRGGNERNNAGMLV